MRSLWILLLFCFVFDIFRVALVGDSKKSENQIENTNSTNTEMDLQPGLNITFDNSLNNDLSRFEIEDENMSEEKIKIKIKFCTTSMSKHFDDVKKELTGYYSNIEVEGSEYPIDPIKKMLSKLVFFIQIGIIILMVGSNYIKPYLSFIPEFLFKFLDEKRFIIGLANYFIAGQITSYLNKTNAFEVYLNGSMVDYYI